jgi:hypothetical protein
MSMSAIAALAKMVLCSLLHSWRDTPRASESATRKPRASGVPRETLAVDVPEGVQPRADLASLEPLGDRLAPHVRTRVDHIEPAVAMWRAVGHEDVRVAWDGRSVLCPWSASWQGACAWLCSRFACERLGSATWHSGFSAAPLTSAPRS